MSTSSAAPRSGTNPPLHQSSSQSQLQSQSRSRFQSPSQILAASLLQECQALLSELSAFQSYLVGLKKPNLVELRQFKSAVQSELKALEKLGAQAEKAVEEDAAAAAAATGYGGNGGGSSGEEEDEEDDGGAGKLGPAGRRVLHSLRSSNLPFYATVWNVATTACTGLIGLSKKFYWEETKQKRKRPVEVAQVALESDFEKLGLSNGEEEKEDGMTVIVQKRNVFVDIVADNGAEWIKVSTVTPSRLLFELAKQGWELDSEAESERYDEDATQGNGNITNRLYHHDGDDDDDDVMELVKLATDMKKAAAHERVRYRHPRVRFVLPKIEEGQVSHIDRVIHEIRRTGVVVECGHIPDELSNRIQHNNSPDALESKFTSLLPSSYPGMTSTLNVDCTLLLAMVSDVSHIRNIAHSPTHHVAITRQIELEAKEPLGPSALWPVMGDRELVCTQEAATRMRDIVAAIGTETEKERTQLLLGETADSLDQKSLVARFQKVSDHSVPCDWKLPIRVVDAHKDIEQGWKEGRLPPVAHKIAAELSGLNTSVFLYGWATGLMTISSNRTIIKQIEHLVEENRGGDDDLTGPIVWVCDIARSLVGKESNRKP